MGEWGSRGVGEWGRLNIEVIIDRTYAGFTLKAPYVGANGIRPHYI
ncbi:MAG: hypothetical protein SWX82_16785 [Cyanobacteriota bacterium]|nr:hypothetical protein [Cyanobacteriota bacterium]